jgi:hypothetical protein
MIRKAHTYSLAILGVLVVGLPGLAQQPTVPTQAPPPRQIFLLPNGWMLWDATGVIVRVTGKDMEGSTTTIVNSANGVGNRIVVNNGGASGVTILQNVRNGIGNSVTVTPTGTVIERSDRVPEKK